MTTGAVRVREQRRQRGSSSATTLSAKKSKNEEKEMDKNNERTDMERPVVNSKDSVLSVR
jgi:hypothetical protein